MHSHLWPHGIDWAHIPHVMKTNIGSYDAGVRFIGGCTLLFFSANGLGWWALLGLIPILTAAIGAFVFARQWPETPTTVFGSITLASAHVINWRLRHRGHAH